ncbi:MAG: FdhF/YdeP family oxidoreductase [Polyangiaceae bacterium]
MAPPRDDEPAALAPVVGGVRGVPYRAAAAGPGGVFSSLKYAARTSGMVRGARALRTLNQTEGFDCPGCAWPDPAHRSTFEFCENGARAVAHEADARRVDAAFFEAHSVDSLRDESDYLLEQQGRLVVPAVRAPGDTHYRAVSYDEAFDLIARELRAIEDPNEAIFYTSGRTSNEAAFLYQLFARSLGTNNLPDCSNLCHESSGKGLGGTIGIGKGTVTLADFDACDCVLILGQNPGTNHPRMLSTLAEAARRGAKIISINPLRERGLERFAHPQTVSGMLGIGKPISTHYVQVRINGDVPLLKGIMKEVLAIDRERPVLDRAFIESHTTGFDALVESLEREDFALLEERSGVDRKTMRALAEVYVASERVIACWAMGITQHKNGVDNVREILNLLLLRGNIGREGAGVCPVRGHSNVQGDRTVGIYEAPTEAFLKRLDEGTGITSPRAHGHDVVGAIRAMEEGAARFFMALGGNFVAASPDTDRTARAMAGVRCTVQVSTKLNRSHVEAGATAIILPCLARSERDSWGGGAPEKHAFVTVENSMGVVHRSQGNLAPAAPTLLSEPAIVAQIASRALPKSRVPWLDLAADYDRIRDLIERSIAGFDRYNERVREPHGFALPNGPRVREWKTASGRAEFSVVPVPEHELTDEQLMLMTIRSHDQFNTTVYALDDRYRGIFGERRVVFLNPEDMRERGLVEGQVVDIQSHFPAGVDAATPERREVRGFSCIPYDIPRRCAAAYFPETNPLVPLESYANESRTPTSKSIVITLTPAAQSPADWAP